MQKGSKDEEWAKVLPVLSEEVREAVESLVTDGVIRPGEIDEYEITVLSSLSPADGCMVIQLFREGSKTKKVGNKSGFLAGIMKRVSKGGPDGRNVQACKTRTDPETEIETGKNNLETCCDIEGTNKNQNKKNDNGKTTSDGNNVDCDAADGNRSDGGAEKGVEKGEGEGEGEGVLSRRERKKLEQAEIEAINDEEGINDEEDGHMADDHDKLVGFPMPGDSVLYAVPMCGPYSAMQNFKYRIKLTPGPMKKGKACKQAVDLFARMKECLPNEKPLLKALSDPEMVAIMIGDVKLSMPGLFAAKRQMKGKDKGQKKLGKTELDAGPCKGKKNKK